MRSFWQSRKVDYPNHFFYDRYDRWDNRSCKNQRLSQSMKINKCTGNHQSFMHPTTLKNAWQPSQDIGKTKRDGDSSEMIVT